MEKSKIALPMQPSRRFFISSPGIRSVCCLQAVFQGLKSQCQMHKIQEETLLWQSIKREKEKEKLKGAGAGGRREKNLGPRACCRLLIRTVKRFLHLTTLWQLQGRQRRNHYRCLQHRCRGHSCSAWQEGVQGLSCWNRSPYW